MADTNESALERGNTNPVSITGDTKSDPPFAIHVDNQYADKSEADADKSEVGGA